MSGVAADDFARRLALKIANADGCNEIRAQYSGFFLAVAGICAAALLGVVSRPATFMVPGRLPRAHRGRLASLVIDRRRAQYGPTILALYVIDSIGFALAIIALVGDSRLAGTQST